MAHLLASILELAIDAFNYAAPLLSALDPADSFGCEQWVELAYYLVFSSSSAGAKDPLQAFLPVVQINQAGGVDCWSDCIAEAQAEPRLTVRLTADASATGSWVHLARLQEQAFVTPTVGMVSPASRPAPLNASAPNVPGLTYLLLSSKHTDSRKQSGASSQMRTSPQ